jgi:hypothetical protein
MRHVKSRKRTQSPTTMAPPDGAKRPNREKDIGAALAMRAPLLDPILSIAEIAALEGVSIATKRREIRAGRGPPIIQLSPRRIGVRQSDYAAHCEARLRRPGST